MLIEFEQKGAVGILRLSRPKVNAITDAMVGELTMELVRLENDKSVRGVILTGLPGIFSAGLDVVDLLPRDREYIRQFWTKFNNLLIKILTYPKLIFTAISGHSPAGGAVIAIMTDYRIMAEGDFKIGLNEVAVGLILPHAIGKVFQYLVGTRQAEKLALTGSMMNPETALSMGMVDEVLPAEHLMETTIERMNQWLMLPGYQQSLTKSQLRKSMIEHIHEGMDEDVNRIVDIWFNKSFRKTMTAVVERLTQKQAG